MINLFSRKTAWIAMMLMASSSLHAQQVPVVRVKQLSLASEMYFEAVVQAANQSTVSSQASGRVLSLLVKPGDHVKAGQLLATIDDRAQQAGVAQARAQTRQAAAALGNVKNQLDRSRDLKSKGFVSQAALDAAESQYNEAKSALEAASAGARQSSISAENAKVNAPFDGIVQQTFLQVGDMASPGAQLLIMYAPLPLRVAAQIPLSSNSLARSAGKVLIEVGKAQGAKAAIARSSLELPGSDPVSQTVEWRFELSELDAKGLSPGQRARVGMLNDAPSEEKKIMVPLSSVVKRGELTAAYVVEGGRFSLRAIRLGGSFGSHGVEVVSGLKKGDLIALDTLGASATGAEPAQEAR